MAVITDEQRLLLHKAAEKAMGTEAANVLLAGMPARDWDDIATKADLAHVEERLRGELAVQRSELLRAIERSEKRLLHALNTQAQAQAQTQAKQMHHFWYGMVGVVIGVAALPQVLAAVL